MALRPVRRLLNQRGQFVVEAMLLVVLIISFSLVIIRGVKESKLASNMVTEPWKKVAGMAEFGTWHPSSDDHRKKHPNNYERLFTPDPN